eukprot:Skav231761  [mRNA]  locus=scaffold695:176775:189959:- [translate_table: standard]
MAFGGPPCLDEEDRALDIDQQFLDQIQGAITGFLLVMVLVEDVFPEALGRGRGVFGTEDEPWAMGWDKFLMLTLGRAFFFGGLLQGWRWWRPLGPSASMGMPGKGGPPMNQEVLGEFYGIVKSYNPEKGFGFIVCDALKNQHDGDVYLHSRHIGDFKVGQEVKFQAYLHNGRLQGRELQDATGMVGPQTGFAPLPTAGGGEEQELGVFVGKIKNWNHEKGFGFIVCEALNLQACRSVAVPSRASPAPAASSWGGQGYQGDVFLHSKNKGTFEAGDEAMGSSAQQTNLVAFMAVLRNSKLQAKDLQAPG